MSMGFKAERVALVLQASAHSLAFALLGLPWIEGNSICFVLGKLLAKLSEAVNLPRAGVIPLPPVWKNNESAAFEQRHCPAKRGELLVLPKSSHHTLVLTLSYEPLVAL